MVNLQIPGIKNYNEDVLLLVASTTTYSEKVPVMVGSKIIDQAMRIITKGELAKVTTTWKQAHFGAVMSGLLQLPHTGSNRTGVEKDVAPSSLMIDTMEVKEFCLDDVQGPVCTTQRVILLQFSTISMHGNTSVRGHCMWVNVLMEPMPGPQFPTAVVPTVTNGDLHLESSWVPICLHNLSARSIEILWLARLCLPTKCHCWSFQQGFQRNSTAIPKRDGSWRPWTSKALGNGLNLSKNRPENCCSNGNICLPTVTWT